MGKSKSDVTCGNCGAANQAEATFCHHCRAPDCAKVSGSKGAAKSPAKRKSKAKGKGK